MGDYGIGRDLQELRSRVERLEGLPGARGPLSAARVGVAAGHQVVAGTEREKAPIVWKAQKDFLMPPFVHGLLGLPPGVKLDSAQSKTWSCHPEPLILFVTWDAGGTDEYFRFSNQLFSLIRVTDPNTNITTFTVSYSAMLTASGKGATAWWSGAYGGQYGQHYFDVTLRDASGGQLGVATQGFIVDCHDNYPWGLTANFNPGLYDIVAGATWQIRGARVRGC